LIHAVTKELPRCVCKQSLRDLLSDIWSKVFGFYTEQRSGLLAILLQPFSPVLGGRVTLDLLSVTREAVGFEIEGLFLISPEKHRAIA
jgi:hypothetical protein